MVKTMAKKVKVLVLRTAGTNCDAETVFAFKHFGAQVDLHHVNKLFNNEVRLADYHVLALPGGFSYGDDIESGRILANELRLRLGTDIQQFISDGKLVVGICNGFQILVKAGILPGPLSDDEARQEQTVQKVTLMNNDSGKFEDRWIHLQVLGASPWTEGLTNVITLPVAHGEGKFVAQDNDTLLKLQNNGQVVFRYCSENGQSADYPANPNGSIADIAGITDRTGRVLGLMPHPERHFLFVHHPHWTRLPKNGKYGDGAKIFENAVRYAKEKLL